MNGRQRNWGQYEEDLRQRLHDIRVELGASVIQGVEADSTGLTRYEQRLANRGVRLERLARIATFHRGWNAIQAHVDSRPQEEGEA